MPVKASRGGRRANGGKGIKESDIISQRSLISERERNAKQVDLSLATLKEMGEEYGAAVGDLLIAELKGHADTLGFSTGENISINNAWFNDKIDLAYKEAVAMGFHPHMGNKTGVQAVMAHEFGHNLTYIAGQNMGIATNTLHSAADRIVNEARALTKDKGVVIMARKISEYATTTNAEAVAEAVADVYCNGGRAKNASQTIVHVLKKYL